MLPLTNTRSSEQTEETHHTKHLSKQQLREKGRGKHRDGKRGRGEGCGPTRNTHTEAWTGLDKPRQSWTSLVDRQSSEKVR